MGEEIGWKNGGEESNRTDNDLALLVDALVTRLAGNEADELGGELLHALLGLLRDLATGCEFKRGQIAGNHFPSLKKKHRTNLDVLGKHGLHDLVDAGHRQEPVL